MRSHLCISSSATPRLFTTMHKIDLGFHRHNISATTPSSFGPRGASSSAPAARAGSGPQLQHGSPVQDMLTCSVRHASGSMFTVRCLPVEDGGGLLDLSGQDPTDAVVGDQLTAADLEEAKQAAAHKSVGLPNPNSATDRPIPTSPVIDDINLAHAIRARVPKGDLAYNAAFCEPIPGDPPGKLTDDDIAALRGQPGPRGLDDLRGAAAGEAGATSGFAGRSSSPSAPANDPKHIKEVVRDETINMDSTT